MVANGFQDGLLLLFGEVGYFQKATGQFFSGDGVMFFPLVLFKATDVVEKGCGIDHVLWRGEVLFQTEDVADSPHVQEVGEVVFTKDSPLFVAANFFQIFLVLRMTKKGVGIFHDSPMTWRR